MRILWSALKKTCTAIGAVVLFFMIIGLMSLGSLFKDVEVELPKQMVLFLEFDGALSDLPKEVSLLDPFEDSSITMRRFIDALDRAKNDPRVEGIYARLENGGYQIAHIQEMREAIKRFRESGKFAYIYSPSYAEAGGIGSYYLATAFDEIWMQPMGVLTIGGVNAEMPFMRDLLDKIGVEPNFYQRKEYKSAYESLTNKNISPANQQMMEALIGDIAKTMQKDISADLKITETQFRAYVDQGLFTSGEAEKLKLIHHADYADALVSKINQQIAGTPDLYAVDYVNIVDYITGTDQNNIGFTSSFIHAESKESTGKPRVALIYAVGTIMSSKDVSMSAPSIAVDDGVAAADEIGGAILDAAEDPDIDSIVLRIDSPGGSPVASETILRSVQKAKEKGKYVIVSMGPTAASGGYWIAAYADQIFTLPSTLTGSIGVLGGKVSLTQLWEKVGVNWDSIKWGQNSGMWSMNTPFSPTEAERMNAMLDNVYENFIKRVAKGRKMKESNVDKIARGRVWTGNQAIKLGLADQLGGLTEALDFAALQAGKKTRNDVEIVVLPVPLTPLEEFLELMEGQVLAGQVFMAIGQMGAEIMPSLGEVAMIKAQRGPQVYEPLQIR